MMMDPRLRRALPRSFDYAQDDEGRGPAARGLLLVVFDGFGVADVGGFGVLAGVDAGAALTEEVPVLIELDLDGFEALTIFFGHFVTVAITQQTMFFGDEFFDVRVNLRIGHSACFPFGGRFYRQ
jgi:hypothetical protein